MGGLLLGSTADAAPRSPLGLTLAVKLDALRAKLTGAPKAYRDGQLVVGARKIVSGPDGTRTTLSVYRIEPGAKVDLGFDLDRRVGRDQRLRFVRTNTYEGARSTQHVLYGSGASELSITRHADASRKLPLVTYTSRDEGGQRVAHAVFDHQTSQRRTTQHHADGSRSVTLSQVLRTADGLATEDIVDKRRYVPGE